jgi:hypothetical protein
MRCSLGAVVSQSRLRVNPAIPPRLYPSDLCCPCGCVLQHRGCCVAVL